MLCLLLTVPVCNALYVSSPYKFIQFASFISILQKDEMSFVICVSVSVCLGVSITKAFTSSGFQITFKQWPCRYPLPVIALLTWLWVYPLSKSLWKWCCRCPTTTIILLAFKQFYFGLTSLRYCPLYCVARPSLSVQRGTHPVVVARFSFFEPNFRSHL